MGSTKKTKTGKPKAAPGPEAGRLVIEPGELGPGLGRLLKKGAPPLDQRKKKPKGKP